MHDSAPCQSSSQLPVSVSQRPSPVVCVDLDGTLIASDLLHESICLLVREQPASLLKLPFWLIRGRAHFKAKIAELVLPDPQTLPYIQEVITFVKEARESGARTALVTAAQERHALAVANHLGLFDDVIASDGETNLKGKRKLEAIRQTFGETPFDYVGDSRADLPVWREARQALLVRPSPGVLSEVRRTGQAFHIFENHNGGLKSYLKLLRPHQWTKNLLLIVPLITAHLWTDPKAIMRVLLALVIFCLSASAVYIVNDLLDLPADRRHRSKRFRPLAAGKIAIPSAVAIAVTLLATAAAGAFALPLAFAGCLLLYVVLTTGYSIYFKRKTIVDVICLAGLYTLRIIAGGAASTIPISPWLLAFSMFFFLSLAFVKRYSELVVKARIAAYASLEGRGYMPIDLDLIRSIGPAMGGISVLVMCLYINSPDVLKLYRHPHFLWLICPILLYWITRVWLLAGRQQMQDDPIVFALTDRISYLSGILVVVLLLLGI